ncbi:LEA type 2 family protein [Pseudoteredinibacter isoporae]|uniref:LEA14-like dessication related protein n=1 Tax=Pseudoteredinibacter isoporae TaxID=570281 RepID=A0A7X0JQH9_9GAMM|nr:LEA type 2 family protein [Pseudoteredinibacter isoporae]MBB6520438.1 LEA14-like dessication related protein [Pseudoteredinibacter isoporae]NHO86006.1 LEA type 2 family protein [Pseudoteredinibacter isoporae]NIB25543.1 LEA type 2 family protein [Pseudoteredinibacter isoporae]
MKFLNQSRCLVQGFFLLVLLGVLSACSHLPNTFEEPRLQVLDIQMLPGENLSPTFNIKLKVDNPNRFDLDVVGASYSVSLQGFEVIHGVAKDIPTIGAYDSEEFTVKAQANVIQGVRLLNKLMQKQHEPLNYRMSLKLDTGSLFSAIRIEDEGKIDLNGAR